ncbi:IS21-like element helper ATPase IstB [Arthrobacter bambusae]|uniref:IS21-like element helper ATPase IstB n=1 Tax=Arthrobacter bambusae TaxID=1338426 RepID=UPI00277F3231|nr:IS21-like element helper ATPase IstB [Arthrobacter bambusae]MDQ0213599.1 DNA replication protein DnaC [Arthrobacter bambusae]MDQ0237934.1 DNA replication protein DnaC [Arthrobacter bambusae]
MTTTGREITKDLAFFCRALRTPVIGDVYADLAEQARGDGWSHEQYLAAVLARQVSSREANGTRQRIARARFPSLKTLEDFNFDYQPKAPRDVISHLATTTFIEAASNVVLLGPPGVGKTHLAIALGVKAAQAGHSVLFDSATNWVRRLAAAHESGTLPDELKRLRRYRLLILDELGYLPFDPDSANLFFQLISARYEQGALILTSNLPFARWGEALSDDVVAAATIDRIVHHADVIALDGKSFRTRNINQNR